MAPPSRGTEHGKLHKRLVLSIDASIEIANLTLSYLPGETISGAVKTLNINHTMSHVTVLLSLIGNIQTEVRVDHYTMQTSRYAGYAQSHNPKNAQGPRVACNDFNRTEISMGKENMPGLPMAAHDITRLDMETSESRDCGKGNFLRQTICLYQGPVSRGDKTWFFNLTIPQFLARDEMAVALPSTYMSEAGEYLAGSGGHRSYLFCQYHLEAEIVKFDDPQKPLISTCPIFIGVPSDHVGVEPRVWAATALAQPVKTFLLYPEIGVRHVALKELLKDLISRGPSYSFKITVAHPTFLRINDPAFIPIRISADFVPQLTTIPYTLDTLPKIRLLGICIKLQYSTRAMNLAGNTRATDSTSDWATWGRMVWEETGSPARMVPYADPNSPEARDIGQEFQMRVSWGGLQQTGLPKVYWKQYVREKKVQVWPSMDNYHINVQHRLKWHLMVECIGKRRKVRGMAPITVRPPSAQNDSNLVEATAASERIAYTKWTRNMLWVPFT